MAPKIVQQVKAHYTPDDIKALIVADMRSHGFADIVLADIDDEDQDQYGDMPRPAMPADHVEPFNGYWISKDIPVKPKPVTRETFGGNENGRG